MRRRLGCMVLVSVVAAAGVAEAQYRPESTAMACQNRYDDDGDGYADCADQDCGAFCGGGSQPAAQGTSLGGRLDSFLVNVRAGPAIGLDGGLSVGAGVMLGSGWAYGYVGARLVGGAAVGNGNPTFSTGIEATFRPVLQLTDFIALYFNAGLGYMHRWAWGSYEYRFHLPKARIGAGLLFGSDSRVRHGLELGFDLGYAIHDNTNENPWGDDYSFFYFLSDLSYSVTF